MDALSLTLDGTLIELILCRRTLARLQKRPGIPDASHMLDKMTEYIQLMTNNCPGTNLGYILVKNWKCHWVNSGLLVIFLTLDNP